MKKTRFLLVFFALVTIVVFITSCSELVIDCAFTFSFVSCSTSEYMDWYNNDYFPADPGCVYKKVIFDITNKSNSPWNLDLASCSITLKNKHRYLGMLHAKEVMPDASGTITIYFEVSDSESFNDATISIEERGFFGKAKLKLPSNCD